MDNLQFFFSKSNSKFVYQRFCYNSSLGSLNNTGITNVFFCVFFGDDNRESEVKNEFDSKKNNKLSRFLYEEIEKCYLAYIIQF